MDRARNNQEYVEPTGEFEGRSPSHLTTSPSPLKERGTQGVRMIIRFYMKVAERGKT